MKKDKTHFGKIFKYFQYVRPVLEFYAIQQKKNKFSKIKVKL